MAVLVSKAALQFLHGNCIPADGAARILHAFVIFDSISYIS